MGWLVSLDKAFEDPSAEGLLYMSLRKDETMEITATELWTQCFFNLALVLGWLATTSAWLRHVLSAGTANFVTSLLETWKLTRADWVSGISRLWGRALWGERSVPHIPPPAPRATDGFVYLAENWSFGRSKADRNVFVPLFQWWRPWSRQLKIFGSRLEGNRMTCLKLSIQ